MTMGQRIAQKRKEQGLSQEGLGEQLGVSRQAIYKWESGAAVPEIDKLIALSRLFGVSVGWLLGVEELPDHTLRVQGLLEPRELVDEFTALLQDPRVVSANLLTPGDIQVLHVDGGDIVAITVPPAEQDQRPVYIGGDLARGSYRRSGDGDYHCTRAELNAMLGGRSH